ncbi:tyrosine-type recombinase/integrase [Micromonospora sp. Llam0]|uniref:tyrosine-type recombinase/integrase n=1 Tax=Micromonospora sp. Llam0 TaxID=2485143 RepID=UPI0013154DD8|nr:tyrosine-type recombinase/integrase [Micromonospora sp. Llam0]
MATPADMITAHLTWMRAGRYADTTIDDARKLLTRLHRELPAGIHQALPEELAEWLSQRGWSSQTRATYYKHIVRLYKWAAGGRDPWLSFDPSTELSRPLTRPGLPRPAEAEAVRVAIHELPGQWTLVGRLVALAGLRPVEVARLTREQVTAQTIVVTGKGGKTRAIPTHQMIWDLVEPMPPGRLIVTRHGGPPTPKFVTTRGAHYLRAAEHNITLYRLRHYFGTEIQARFKDARVTQELMGHASLNTSQGYMQVTSDRMRQAIDMLSFGGVVATGASPAESEMAGGPGGSAVSPPLAAPSGRTDAARRQRPRLGVSGRAAGDPGRGSRRLRRAGRSG